MLTLGPERPFSARVPPSPRSASYGSLAPAGTAVELHQALLCNPFDTAGMKRVIETALTLPVEEQRQRVRAMRTHLWANTVHDWAEGFFRHLDDVHPRGQRG